MTKEEIQSELASLDQQAVEILAKANFINGAKQAFLHMLSKLEPVKQPEAPTNE